jgi:hypothetical protein
LGNIWELVGGVGGGRGEGGRYFVSFGTLLKITLMITKFKFKDVFN